MSSNYSPWETSDSAGADLTGTMTADRASGPSYGDILQPVPQGAPQPSATPNPVAMLGQFQAAQQEAQGQQMPFFRSLTLKADGSASIDTDQSALAEVFAQLTDLKQMKTAAMARVAQLQQQESSGSPILDALSQFAGNMAQNDPTMPGWVRALGATNLQMGPQGIKRERMAEEAKAFAYGKEISDTALQAEKIREYSETQKAKVAGDSLDARRLALMEREQESREKNQRLDNFRADLSPVLAVVKQTGLFNADQETAIRQTAANHEGLPPGAVEAEIAKAKGNAAAARAEKERVSAERRANTVLRASEYATRLAAQEGKQIRGQVVRANLSQAGKMADGARIDEKEALRLQGLNEMSIAADRMEADLASDPTWQGVIAGRVAETAKLTTAQQAVISNSADLFVKKMSSLGVSFAKTSDAEMKKILATVPTATMTVGQAKRLLAIINQEGQRAAEFIAQRNWAETPEALAASMPSKYRDAALRAHGEKVSRLTPQQRLAYGLATGDEGIVQSEVERAIAGSPGGTPIVGGPQRSQSSVPGMATPKTNKDDPEGLLSFLPKR